MAKKKQKIEILHFNVLGDWVTETARSWLYEERRPYEKVLDFLLSSMEGSGLSEEELRKYANDILLGRRKLTGSTANHTYHMEDDDTDIISRYQEFFNNRPLINGIDEEEYEEELEEKIAESRARIDRFFTTIGDKNSKDYGWLNPDGKFYPVPWGEHTKWAYEYVEKYYPKAEYMDEADYLVSRKWILIHSPTNSIPIINTDRATKRQKEFIYDYFMDRGMQDEANSVWKSDHV
jgi:hypothetical protein